MFLCYPLTHFSHLCSRKPPPPDRPPPRFKLPTFGGTVTIALVASTQPQRKPKARILAELQARSRLGGLRPSEDVESMHWEVKWEPQKGALGVPLPAEDSVLGDSELSVASTRPNLFLDKSHVGARTPRIWTSKRSCGRLLTSTSVASGRSMSANSSVVRSSPRPTLWC